MVLVVLLCISVDAALAISVMAAVVGAIHCLARDGERIHRSARTDFWRENRKEIVCRNCTNQYIRGFSTDLP